MAQSAVARFCRKCSTEEYITASPSQKHGRAVGAQPATPDQAPPPEHLHWSAPISINRLFWDRIRQCPSDHYYAGVLQWRVRHSFCVSLDFTSNQALDARLV